jgi:hypothetical protein
VRFPRPLKISTTLKFDFTRRKVSGRKTYPISTDSDLMGTMDSDSRPVFRVTGPRGWLAADTRREGSGLRWASSTRRASSRR